MNRNGYVLSALLLLMSCDLSSAKSAEEVFSEIYETNTWGNAESVSGPGSTLKVTAILRKELKGLLKRYGIEKINDAPCGDFNWMKKLRLQCIYRGFDVVKDLIDRNNKLFSSANIHFYNVNLIMDILPEADIIICRDLLAHLPTEDIFKVLSNFKKSKSKYLLTTTYTRTKKINYDIPMGRGRRINLCLPPFNFPQPIELINEGCTERYGHGIDSDKCVGLWLLSDIHVTD